MNHLLGNILLKQYLAESNEDWDLVNKLKIKADALILQIRSLKNSTQWRTRKHDKNDCKRSSIHKFYYLDEIYTSFKTNG